MYSRGDMFEAGGVVLRTHLVWACAKDILFILDLIAIDKVQVAHARTRYLDQVQFRHGRQRIRGISQSFR